MNYYKLYELTIETELEFRQLVACEKSQADVTIRSGQMPQDLLEEEDKCKFHFEPKRGWVINDTCQILVENGKEIIYHLNQGCSVEHLKTYILGWGMAILSLQLDQIAMHCSAISKEGQAILISGEPGTGKSTVTSKLLEEGWQLMADDMAFVEVTDKKAYVKPAFPYQKLCRDAAIEQGYDLDQEIYIDEDKDKFLVRYKGAFNLGRVWLKSLIILTFSGDDAVMYQKVSGINSFYAWGENMFLRKLLRQDKYSPEIGAGLLKAAGASQVYVIARPRKGDSLSQVLAAINDILKQ